MEYVRGKPAVFELYDLDSLIDVDDSQQLIEAVDGEARLSLQMFQSTDLNPWIGSRGAAPMGYSHGRGQAVLPVESGQVSGIGGTPQSGSILPEG